MTPKPVTKIQSLTKCGEITMALFINLFHKKGQLRGIHAPNKGDAFLDMDEEDLEDDDPNDEEESFENEENKEYSESEEPNEEKTYEVLEREILPAKIICPDCGGITLEGLDYCDKCGGELH
jgi:hypothetical protein